MGVQNAPKGFDLFLENGWRHEVVATSGRYELRVYPERLPVLVSIAVSTSLLAAKAFVRQRTDGWVVEGTVDVVLAHEQFPDPIAAFEWWIREISPAL
jgi:hypothetical protein